MALAPLSAIARPPVLYSFPSEIRIARWHHGRVFGLKHGLMGEAVPTWLEVRWNDATDQYQISVDGIWSPKMATMSYDYYEALTEEIDRANDHHGSAR